MRLPALAAVLAVSLAASAARGDEREHHRRPSGDLRVEHEPRGPDRTLVRIPGPEGVRCVVRQGGALFVEATLPLLFAAERDALYEVQLFQPGLPGRGGRFLARAGHLTTVWLPGEPSAAEPGPVPMPWPGPPPPAAAPPPPPPPAPMAPERFGDVLSAIHAEHFNEGKLRILEAALPGNHLTVAQVERLLELIRFPGDDKLRVVELTRDRILDRDQLYRLYGHFTFDSEKEALRRILGQ